MSEQQSSTDKLFTIQCASFDGRERNEFFVTDEGQSVDGKQEIHEFLVRVTDKLDSPEAVCFMELKLVKCGEGEWRIDQINHHENKHSPVKRFYGKGVPNELLPAVAQRCGIIIKSSPPLELVTRDSGTVWRTPDATRMWKNLASHLESIESEYCVEYIKSETDDFYQLVKRAKQIKGE